MPDIAATTLVAQLRTVLQLTQTEAQIARTRQAQARTDAVRRELAENAANSDERARSIAEALGELGAVPDVVSPAVGWLTAFAKTGIEQAQPLGEALLGDLALEHQLLDRARYVKVLADAAEAPRVRRLAERLETAHTATVEWLTIVLAEDALGGPTALRRTPLQVVVGGAVRLANVPLDTLAERINRGVAEARARRERASAAVGSVRSTAGDLADAAVGIFQSGRDASLTRAEKEARQDGADDTAKALHQVRGQVGALGASEIPVRGYDQMLTGEAVAAVKKLTKPADVRAMLAYEEAHKNRSGVVSAIQTQVAAVAKAAVGVA